MYAPVLYKLSVKNDSTMCKNGLNKLSKTEEKVENFFEIGQFDFFLPLVG